MTNIVYTSSARLDLLEAWLFIAEDNLNAADQMLETINENISMLAQRPLLGRERPELHESLRSWITQTPYILYYAPEADGLTIVRVLHYARDIQNIDMSH